MDVKFKSAYKGLAKILNRKITVDQAKPLSFVFNKKRKIITYNSIANNFSFSKQHMKSVQESERDSEPFTANLSKVKARIRDQFIANKLKTQFTNREINPLYLDTMANRVKRQSAEAKKKFKLNCFLIKQVDTSIRDKFFLVNSTMDTKIF